jgi:beta-galactosidase
MGRTLEFDHFAVGAQMEIATWDSYPLGFLEDRWRTRRSQAPLRAAGRPGFPGLPP